MAAAVAPVALDRDEASARARMLRVAAQVLRVRFTPPERLTVCEWADKYRWLPETSARPGKYDSSSAPYQREPMDTLGDPRHRKVVFMFASQTGKSLIIENAIGHGIHLRPRPIIVVQPKIDSAEAWSKERFMPMVAATPVLASRVASARTRDAENTLRYKKFSGGFLAVATSNSPAELAARSCARAYCDEVDRFPESAGSEGRPVGIVERRMGAIDDAKLVLASTPGDKETSVIEPAYLAGDQRRFYVPCPHCQEMQTLSFGTPTSPGGLRFDRDDRGKFIPGSARYLCAHCACLIDEAHKPWMLSRGEWRAENPDGDYPSFHLTALYSPFGGTTWQIIASQFLDALGKPLELKVFMTTMLAETWTEPGEQVDTHALVGRLEEYPAEVPKGVGILTAATDVQVNRLERRVWGWGAGEESWLIAVDVIPGDPGSDQVWREWDALRARSYKHEGGADLRVSIEFVDAGDGQQTAKVYEVCRRRFRSKVFACKGVGGPGVPLVGKPHHVGNAKTVLYTVGTNAAKDSFLRSRLKTQAHGPGFVHLPDWCDVDELEQLTAEKLVLRRSPGKPTQRLWVKKTGDARNEALDCQNYAHAALHALGLKVLAALGIYAQQASARGAKPGVAVPESPAPVAVTIETLRKPPPVRRRGGFVGRW